MMFSNNSETQIKVALYARVSSEDQVERETIQNQVQFADSLCPALGLQLANSYLDDGVSGTIPLELRPEGARLLEDARQGKFQQVVVYRLDRIGRTGLVILSAWEALKQEGIALRSLTEPFDTSQPFGEFVMGILAMVAGYERDSIVMRTTEGRRRKAREGKWTGGRAPLGYRVVAGQLEIDEDEAELIRRIFSQYTDDKMSAYRIATQLNAEEVPTQSTRRGFTTKRIKQPNHWDWNRILYIIKSETYAGIRHVGKKGKGEIISQTVPAIVTRETWETAQRLVRANQSNAPRNAKRDYLLRGLLLCGLCNRRFVGYVTNSAHNAYYKCGAQGCSNKPISAELAETVIWEDISKFISNPGPVLEQLRQKMSQLKGDDGKQALSEVESGLARLAEERQRILYLIRKGLISNEEGEPQLVATGQERDALFARKATLEARINGQIGEHAQMSAAEALLRELHDRAEGADNTVKRQVIETLVQQATVMVGEDRAVDLDVTYRFGDPGGIVYNSST